jgi:hypothetical protein
MRRRDRRPPASLESATRCPSKPAAASEFQSTSETCPQRFRGPRAGAPKTSIARRFFDPGQLTSPLREWIGVAAPDLRSLRHFGIRQ